MAHGHFEQFDQFAQTPTVRLTAANEVSLELGQLRMVFSAGEARLAALDLVKAADLIGGAAIQKGNSAIHDPAVTA